MNEGHIISHFKQSRPDGKIYDLMLDDCSVDFVMDYHTLTKEETPRECTAHHHMSNMKDSRNILSSNPSVEYI